MTILWSNNASTTVSGSITPASTTVQLAAGTGAMFPNPTSGNYYVATFYDQATKTQYEIVHVTAMSGDIATIQRAQEGTTAKNWGPGDIFSNLVTAGTLNAFVQAGTGPADTSIVYVGTDTSTTVNLVIANTNPVPSALATGMLFNIKIKNTNTAAVNLQLNGGPSIAATRSNGAAMLSGDITATEEMQFIYNGVNFNTILPDLPKHPSQTVFYVNPSGNDSNTGFANTPTDAFATVQGAINAIKTRYTSQTQITVRVADGTYTGGFADTTNYIASWNIIGNTSNPQNVIINATATGGIGATAGGMCNMAVSGMAFQSYYSNVETTGSGQLTVQNCNFTGIVAGGVATPIQSFGGQLFLWGTCQYAPAGHVCASLFAAQPGHIILGYHDVLTSSPLNMTVTGSPTFGTGTATATLGGIVSLDVAGGSTITGAVTGNRFFAALCGGVTSQGNPTAFPGTTAGVVQAPGYTA